MDEQTFLFRVLISLADIRAALWSLTGAVGIVAATVLAHALLARRRG